jgi:hypothetical protein
MLATKKHATDLVHDLDGLLQPVREFLRCETPPEWVKAALEQQQVLLIDHANCEKKAAATAMRLMYRYTENPTLLSKMSQLAREELLHLAGRRADVSAAYQVSADCAFKIRRGTASAHLRPRKFGSDRYAHYWRLY